MKSNPCILALRTLNQTPYAPLYGCVNDGQHMRNHVLKHVPGLSSRQIHWLKDKAAKRQAWIDLMLHTIIPDTYAEDGGLLISLFSGHGARDQDRRGEGEAESDGYTEFQVPYDYRSKGYWADHELAALYGMVNPTWRVRLWNDCCHSGDSLRAFAIGSMFGKTRRKTLPELHKSKASLAAAWSFLSFKREPLTDARLAMAFGLLHARTAKAEHARRIWEFYQADHFQRIRTHPNLLAVQGCLAHQYSLDAEIDNIRQGAMSAALWKAWAAADGSWADVHARATAWMRANGYGEQTSILEATDPQLTRQPFLRG
jgi:hypothetical protein